MPNALAVTSSVLTALRNLKDLFASLGPLSTRLGAHRTDLDRLTEEFFAAEIGPGRKIRVRGVLSPYSCCVPPLVYRPFVATATREHVKEERFDISTRSVQRRVELTLVNRALSVPASRLNDVTLSDGTSARLAWLYPEGFDGLIFQYEPSPTAGSGQGLSPSDLFHIAEHQRPVPCLLPTTGQWDSSFGALVEVLGQVCAADSAIIAVLATSLDQFRIAHLSRAIRPLEESPLCLAIDLRDPAASVAKLRLVDSLQMVIGVQGLIEIEDLVTGDLDAIFVRALDAVPDRTGMGPLRGMGDQAQPEVTSVISTGDVRWLFDKSSLGIAAYQVVDLANREETTRRISALSHHWQAWQKHARSEIQSAIGKAPKIRPVLVWDPRKINLFFPDGLQLPPRLEAQLFSRDPSVRAAIDWLRIGAGQFGRS